MAAAELRHAENPLGRRTRRREPVNILVVHVVHHDDAVEPPEILLAELARTMRERNAAPGGRTPHARIGQFAAVASVGAGRIDPDAPGEPLLFEHAAHDAFGGRRAADVAEADKKNLVSVFHGCLFLNPARQMPFRIRQR